GLQKLLKGREGRACSGSARQFVPPTWNYLKILDCRTCTDGSAKRRSLDERSIPVKSFYLFYDITVPRRIMTIGLHVKRNCYSYFNPRICRVDVTAITNDFSQIHSHGEFSQMRCLKKPQDGPRGHLVVF